MTNLLDSGISQNLTNQDSLQPALHESVTQIKSIPNTNSAPPRCHQKMHHATLNSHCQPMRTSFVCDCQKYRYWRIAWNVIYWPMRMWNSLKVARNRLVTFETSGEFWAKTATNLKYADDSVFNMNTDTHNYALSDETNLHGVTYQLRNLHIRKRQLWSLAIVLESNQLIHTATSFNTDFLWPRGIEWIGRAGLRLHSKFNFRTA